MKVMQPALRVAAVTALAALLQSCAAEPPALRPAPGANILVDDGSAATASADGITVIAEPDRWPGRVDIEEIVTPMQVTIRNESDYNLRIRYSDFALVSGPGMRLAALPPYEVEGTVTAPQLSGQYGIVHSPAFRAYNFRIAPYYRSIYPTLSPYAFSPFYADPFYYSYYYPHWRSYRIDLPTPEMLRRVLPEGVLEPNGELQGFLYFENVDNLPADTEVSFHAELTDATSGQRFAMLQIPFIANPEDGAESSAAMNRN